MSIMKFAKKILYSFQYNFVKHIVGAMIDIEPDNFPY